MDNYQHFSYRQEGELAIIFLNSPPANALSTLLIEEFDQVLEKVTDDRKIRALIITSAIDKYFIAGANIKEIDTLDTQKSAKEFLIKGKHLMDKIESMNIPNLAAINGFCLGGGMELAMACHFKIASRSATFGQPEINLGIIPGFGGTQRLARIVGTSTTLELILTGKTISAMEAEEMGIVNKVVSEDALLERSKEFVREITAKGKPSISAAINSVIGGLERNMEDGMKLETEEFAKLVETEDMKEGIRAFLEKRQPKFKDK